MQNRSDENHYDNTSVSFHWITAALVLLLWLMAQSESLLPQALRHGMWSAHIAMGALLILVYCTRVVWRQFAGAHLASVNSGLLKIAEHLVHGLLYLLLAATLVAGIRECHCARLGPFRLSPDTGIRSRRQGSSAIH